MPTSIYVSPNICIPWSDPYHHQNIVAKCQSLLGISIAYSLLHFSALHQRPDEFQSHLLSPFHSFCITLDGYMEECYSPILLIFPEIAQASIVDVIAQIPARILRHPDIHILYEGQQVPMQYNISKLTGRLFFQYRQTASISTSLLSSSGHPSSSHSFSSP
jgi:hypothetical protein